MPGLKLMAELGLDGTGFESGMKKAEGLAISTLGSLKGFILAAIGIDAVKTAINRTIETANELVNVSKRLGIAPEKLQIMGQAAKQSGSNLEELAYQFEKIDAAREHYLAGGERGQEFGRAFGALGINKSMLTSQTAAQLFMGPMSNVAKNRSPEELGAIFRELGIRQFGPMIATLKTDFNSLGKKMRETGAIMDTDTAVKLKILSQELSIVSQLIAVTLGPAIVSLLQKILWIVGLVASVGAYLKALVTSINWKDMGRAALGLPTSGKAPYSGSESPLVQAYIAGNKSAEAWRSKLEALPGEFAKLAEQLKNPKSPDFTQSSLPTKLDKKVLSTPSDSLVKVGNFLGGMGVASQIQARMLRAQEMTANNTGMILAALGVHTKGNMNTTEFPSH